MIFSFIYFHYYYYFSKSLQEESVKSDKSEDAAVERKDETAGTKASEEATQTPNGNLDGILIVISHKLFSYLFCNHV